MIGLITILNLQFEIKLLLSYAIFLIVELIGLYSFSGPLIKIAACLVFASFLSLFSEENRTIKLREEAVEFETCTTDKLNESNQIVFSANGVDRITEGER